MSPALDVADLAPLRALDPRLADPATFAGVWLGGCAERGEGSNIRRSAHAHRGREPGPRDGWVCIKSPTGRSLWIDGKKALTLPPAERRPSQLARHELAHLLAPRGTWHGPAWEKEARALGARGRYATRKRRA